MRILLAEDDDLIGSGLEAALRNAGFAVDWARDGLHVKLSLTTTPYDLLILDLGLPSIAGMDLLMSLRAEGKNTPVLVLTARDRATDRILGLDAGADDYVGKPFDVPEVISRCRALVRRSQNRVSDVLTWRDLKVDQSAHSAVLGNRCLPLTNREFAVLVHLLTHVGRPQKKSKIEESVYGWDEEVESNAIEVHISGLRKKLGADAIRTIRGVGYVMERA
ncbi:response regulator [Caballeronia glebae]|uniref:response regulator n=1 Tax=Caballeronia glebae TaxID=1777143 RepID=UPI0038BA7C0E